MANKLSAYRYHKTISLLLKNKFYQKVMSWVWAVIVIVDSFLGSIFIGVPIPFIDQQNALKIIILSLSFGFAVSFFLWFQRNILENVLNEFRRNQ